MRTLTTWSMLIVAPFTIVFATGCRDEVAVTLDEDEVLVTLDEIESTQQEIQSLLDQRAQDAAARAVEDSLRFGVEEGLSKAQLENTTRNHAARLARLRRAYEDDTWDMLGPPGTTGQSIAITYLRELEDERTRLENLAAESRP